MCNESCPGLLMPRAAFIMPKSELYVIMVKNTKIEICGRNNNEKRISLHNRTYDII